MGNWDVARKPISFRNSFSLPEFRQLFHFFKNISQIPRQIKSKKCGIKISLKAQVCTKLYEIHFQSLARVYFPSHLHSTYHCLCIFFHSISCYCPDLLKVLIRLWHLKWCHSSQEKSIIQQRCIIQLSNTSLLAWHHPFLIWNASPKWSLWGAEFMASKRYQADSERTPLS